MDHDKLWKALKEMEIPDHLTRLLRNLYAGQEATVRTLYGTTDWFKTEKGVWQGCLLPPCLFNAYAEHIMRNAGLDELQAGIRIVGRNNNLRYADDTTLMAERKTKIMASGPITSWQIEGEKVESGRPYFLELRNHRGW